MRSGARTTIELSDRTYTRLRARAAERGMRGFSAIVEEGDVEQWELARKEAWATWSADRSSTPTS